MSVLYTINRSPSSALLASCTPLLAEGDGILFIEDGIYYCSQTSAITAIDDQVKLYALEEDLIARGMLDRNTAIPETVNVEGFVQLCCDYDKVVSWF